MPVLLLITCALTLGQAPDRGEWLLAPQYVQGMELVYKGTYTEESLVPGVQQQRQYSLETIFFVQQTTPKCWEAALQTTLAWLPPKGLAANDRSAGLGSVQLELVQVEPQGGLRRLYENPLLIPLTGPPLLETGAFVELPTARVDLQSYWEATEEGRPLRGWQVVGVEPRGGLNCLKLQGSQQSIDWNQPRADSTAWRRKDLIWFAPQVGLVFRVERTIEQREPARQDPTQRMLVAYDLDSRLKFPGKFFEDRKQEIFKSRQFQQEAEPLLRQPAQYHHQIDALLRRIAFYLENNPQTPFRKSIVHLQGRLANGRKGEVPPDPVAQERPPQTDAVAIGKKIPDFVITDLTCDKSRRFHDLLGQPILVLYFNPAANSAREVLRFAQKLHDKYSPAVFIMAMAVTEDVNLVRKQHEELELSFPILDGKAMHRTFGVDGIPRLVVLDGEGVVRSATTGWGSHMPAEIARELERCMPK